MVGSGIADIDHIGLVREIRGVGVVKRSCAVGIDGICVRLGQNQAGAGRTGHAAETVTQIENVVLSLCQVSSMSWRVREAWKPAARNAGQPTGLPARRLCRRPCRHRP